MGLSNIKKEEVVYWETKDGKLININEMSVEHLRNIVKSIAKKRRDIDFNDDEWEAMGFTYGYEFWKD